MVLTGTVIIHQDYKYHTYLYWLVNCSVLSAARVGVSQICQLSGFLAQLGWYQLEVAEKFWSLRVAVSWATFCLKLRVFGLLFGQCSTGTSFLNMFKC